VALRQFVAVAQATAFDLPGVPTHLLNDLIAQLTWPVLSVVFTHGTSWRVGF